MISTLNLILIMLFSYRKLPFIHKTYQEIVFNVKQKDDCKTNIITFYNENFIPEMKPYIKSLKGKNIILNSKPIFPALTLSSPLKQTIVLNSPSIQFMRNNALTPNNKFVSPFGFPKNSKEGMTPNTYALYAFGENFGESPHKNYIQYKEVRNKNKGKALNFESEEKSNKNNQQKEVLSQKIRTRKNLIQPFLNKNNTENEQKKDGDEILDEDSGRLLKKIGMTLTSNEMEEEFNSKSSGISRFFLRKHDDKDFMNKKIKKE